MIVLEKAFIQDRDQVLPLLYEYFGQTPQTINVFHNLFKNHWAHKNDGFVGYLLREEEAVVGFYAYILYERTIEGVQHQFCNMSTWVVNEKARGASLLLVKAISELKKTHTITNFTPNEPSHIVFKRLLKFDDLENLQYLLPFVPFFNIGGGQTFKNEAIQTFILKPEDQKIFDDHSPYKSEHLVYDYSADYLYLVFHVVKKKGLRFLELRYINSIENFEKQFSKIRNKTLLQHFAAAWIIDARLLHHKKPTMSLARPLERSKLFSSPFLKAEQIDGLYSEYFFS